MKDMRKDLMFLLSKSPVFESGFQIKSGKQFHGITKCSKQRYSEMDDRPQGVAGDESE
jgi:hypothetical protein